MELLKIDLRGITNTLALFCFVLFYEVLRGITNTLALFFYGQSHEIIWASIIIIWQQKLSLCSYLCSSGTCYALIYVVFNRIKVSLHQIKCSNIKILCLKYIYEILPGKTHLCTAIQIIYALVLSAMTDYTLAAVLPTFTHHTI